MEFYNSDRKYEQAVLDTEKFCLGLLAALTLQGAAALQGGAAQFTGTRLSATQRHLNEILQTTDGCAAMRRFELIAQTDLKVGFTNALGELEKIGVIEHLGPYFLHLEVTLTTRWSKDILGRFTEPEQAMFAGLAQAFLEVDEL